MLCIDRLMISHILPCNLQFEMIIYTMKKMIFQYFIVLRLQKNFVFWVKLLEQQPNSSINLHYYLGKIFNIVCTWLYKTFYLIIVLKPMSPSGICSLSSELWIRQADFPFGLFLTFKEFRGKTGYPQGTENFTFLASGG